MHSVTRTQRQLSMPQSFSSSRPLVIDHGSVVLKWPGRAENQAPDGSSVTVVYVFWQNTLFCLQLQTNSPCWCVQRLSNVTCIGIALMALPDDDIAKIIRRMDASQTVWILHPLQLLHSPQSSKSWKKCPQNSMSPRLLQRHSLQAQGRITPDDITRVIF